jgi:hypothetical protein
MTDHPYLEVGCHSHRPTRRFARCLSAFPIASSSATSSASPPPPLTYLFGLARHPSVTRCQDGATTVGPPLPPNLLHPEVAKVLPPASPQRTRTSTFGAATAI